MGRNREKGEGGGKEVRRNREKGEGGGKEVRRNREKKWEGIERRSEKE